MKALLDALATELERPRELTEQVIKHLAAAYGLEREAAGDFLVQRLPELEDYEIDLILSPLFTPTIHDQAIFAELLGIQSVLPERWPALVQQLRARPTAARILAGGEPPRLVPLREVTIERYLKRLRLNGTISEALFSLISNLPPPAVRPLLKAVARRAIWDKEARYQILLCYLTATASVDDCRIDDALQLLQLMETYEPRTADLLSRIPHWEKVLRHEIAWPRSRSRFSTSASRRCTEAGATNAPRKKSVSWRNSARSIFQRLRKMLAATSENDSQ
jgi:hypothetical protein